MRNALGAALVGLLFLILASAPALAGKRKVPPRVLDARSVTLGYDLGDRFVAESASIAEPDVRPEERRALEAIRVEIERWGKYVVVEPADAELLIGVRLGVRENVGAGSLGAEYMPGPGGMRRGSSYGPDFASSDDMMAVDDCADGKVGKRLWRERKAGGLAGAMPPLFTRFRADVGQTQEAAKSEVPNK